MFGIQKKQARTQVNTARQIQGHDPGGVATRDELYELVTRLCVLLVDVIV